MKLLPLMFWVFSKPASWPTHYQQQHMKFHFIVLLISFTPINTPCYTSLQSEQIYIYDNLEFCMIRTLGINKLILFTLLKSIVWIFCIVPLHKPSVKMNPLQFTRVLFSKSIPLEAHLYPFKETYQIVHTSEKQWNHKEYFTCDFSMVFLIILKSCNFNLLWLPCVA